jgi:IS30 family transposase
MPAQDVVQRGAHVHPVGHVHQRPHQAEPRIAVGQYQTDVVVAAGRSMGTSRIPSGTPNRPSHAWAMTLDHRLVPRWE